jgi:hypothetical protein
MPSRTRKIGGRRQRGGKTHTRSRLLSLKRARKSYRRRVKGSSCRGKRARTCNKTKGCKRASGKKRSFCRKKKNTRRKRR